MYIAKRTSTASSSNRRQSNYNFKYKGLPSDKFFNHRDLNMRPSSVQAKAQGRYDVNKTYEANSDVNEKKPLAI